ncbi:hypothetical protein [Alistipes sp.]|uniref:hypothetical protein n=1 Tax=Alistipes sp. TaxID=1872444 RepID=UPI003AB14375
MIRMLLTIFAALSLFVFPMFTACSPDDAPFSGTERPDTPGGGDPGSGEKDEPMNRNFLITVGGTTFSATLAENETARAGSGRCRGRLSSVRHKAVAR